MLAIWKKYKTMIKISNTIQIIFPWRVTPVSSIHLNSFRVNGETRERIKIWSFFGEWRTPCLHGSQDYAMTWVNHLSTPTLKGRQVQKTQKQSIYHCSAAILISTRMFLCMWRGSESQASPPPGMSHSAATMTRTQPTPDQWAPHHRGQAVTQSGFV